MDVIALAREYLRYDPDTGILYWRKSHGNAAVGRSVGSFLNGYYRTSFFKEDIYVHRLIWMMHNGPIPIGMEIDHIDHNPSNNLLENLRLATHRENLSNKSAHRNNTSGYMGVSWHSGKKRWHAYIRINGRQHSLGHFKTKEHAINARLAGLQQSDFHENHGQNIAA